MPHGTSGRPTKKFIEAHTGDYSQVAGIRRVRAEEGRAAFAEKAGLSPTGKGTAK